MKTSLQISFRRESRQDGKGNPQFESGMLKPALINRIATTFEKPAKGAAKKAVEKMQVKLKNGFTKYIGEQIKRYSSVKTIISSSTPVPINEIYVNLILVNKENSHRDEDFLKNIDKYGKVLFSATAGAGKSMLMRYLYLKFLELQDERLPIFIELRDLNNTENKTIIEYIREILEDYLGDFSKEKLKYAMNTGKIILFLDGFDEIDFDKRKFRENEINKISARYSDLQVFISSRPSETFANWEQFHVFEVKPFTKKQVRLLIGKINYDQEIKDIFFNKLDKGLYESHHEFLKNPLLTIMMLITLEQFAEVPAKIHLFYEYAFEALFGRHDVTKGGFQRKRHTSLALDDFKRLFSYFCAISYMKDMLTFSTHEVLDMLNQSIEFSQIDVNKTYFKNDLIESTCMIIMDGLQYTFSHRSFQEYFTAYFFARVKTNELERSIPRLISKSSFDNVLKMISEMNREKFEEIWALPTAEKLCALVKNIDAKNKPLTFAKKIMGQKFEILVGLSSNRDLKRIMITVMEDDGDRELSRSRWVLYDIYNFFDLLIEERDLLDEENDVKIYEDLMSGRLLGNDSRFEHFRQNTSKKNKKLRDRIGLIEKDNSWLRKVSFGRFVLAESKLLPKFTDDLRRRVAKRNDGLETIFLEK